MTLLIAIIGPCLINVFPKKFEKVKYENLRTLSKDELKLLEKTKFKECK